MTEEKSQVSRDIKIKTTINNEAAGGLQQCSLVAPLAAIYTLSWRERQVSIKFLTMPTLLTEFTLVFVVEALSDEL